MIKIIMFIAIAFIIIVVFLYLLKMFIFASTKNKTKIIKNNNQNPSRLKYTLPAHQKEILKMEQKIENFEDAIDKRK